MIDSLGAQAHRLYNLGSNVLSQSSLSRINNDKPYTLYQALFGKLLSRCQSKAPVHGFRFNNLLYSLDASTIDLCLSVFSWAEFRTTKAAVKLHVGLSHGRHLTEFVAITEGNQHEVNIGKLLSSRKAAW